MLSRSSSSKVAGRGKHVLALLQQGFALNWPLALCGLVMLMVLLAALVGVVVDPRIITGMPAWVKPAKFAISISIYSLTLLWLLHFLHGHHRLVRLLATSIAVGLCVEMLIIAGQVLRGTTSHFNYTTPLDGTLYTIMAVVIVSILLLSLGVAVLLLRQPMTDPVLAWSLRLGLLLALVGMAVAFLMTTAELQQALYRGLHLLQPSVFHLERLHPTRPHGIVGGHSVGVLDGGPGLPFLGWSTTGGDLRIPHFVGLHALQVLILFGWLLGRPRFAALTVRRRVALVWVFALAYLGLIGLLTWQAMRAQPLLAPDALTLQAGATLLVGTVLSMLSLCALGDPPGCEGGASRKLLPVAKWEREDRSWRSRTSISLLKAQRNILLIGLVTVLDSETMHFLDPSEKYEQDGCSLLCGW
jgi:hypothetical protein